MILTVMLVVMVVMLCVVAVADLDVPLELCQLGHVPFDDVLMLLRNVALLLRHVLVRPVIQ